MLVFSKYLGNINWEVLFLAKFGKLFTECLTAANIEYMMTREKEEILP